MNDNDIRNIIANAELRQIKAVEAEIMNREAAMQRCKVTHKAIIELINQPLDGLLYDLDLLPDQLTAGGWEDTVRRVIVALYERYEPKLAGRDCVVEFDGVSLVTGEGGGNETR